MSSGTDGGSAVIYYVQGVKPRTVDAEYGYVASNSGDEYYWCYWEGAELAVCCCAVEAMGAKDE